MTRAVRWRPEARRDLLAIFLTILQRNPSAAERVRRELEQRAEILRAHPRLGKARADIDQAARVLTVGKYLLIYELLPDAPGLEVETVEIVRVVHGHRDLSGLF